MPNKYTKKLDAIQPHAPQTIGYFQFDKIAPELEELSSMFVMHPTWTDHGATGVGAKQMFFCLIAELSDQDLEECFPELFPSAKA